MTKYYFVKFSRNWSDEFEVTGVSVCDEVRYEHEKRVAAEHSDYEFREIGFGTNESLSELSMSDLFNSFEFIEVSESTHNELKNQLIGSYSEGYGTWFRWPSTVLADHMEYDEDE